MTLTSDGRVNCSCCSDFKPPCGTGTKACGGRGTLVFVVKKVVSLIGNCSLGTDVLGKGLKRCGENIKSIRAVQKSHMLQNNTNNVMPSKDLDQSEHPSSLIRVFFDIEVA